MANEGIQLEIYSYTDWTTKKGFLPGRKKPRALNELKGVGGGSFEVRRADPKVTKDPELLRGRNICKVLVDREVVGAFLIGDRSSTIVSSGERSELTYTIAGSGLKQLFDDARVEAAGGTQQLSSDKRYFNFASEQGSWYNATDWINPFVYGKYNSGLIWAHYPEKWPEIGKNAYWVGPLAYSGSMPAGIWYARHQFTAPAAGKYAIYSAVDNEFDVYVDGAHLGSTQGNGGWQTAARVEVELTAGPHNLAYGVSNSEGPTAILMTMVKVAEDNSETLITQSGTGTWKVLPYPARAPGWSPGEVLGDLLDEAASRGVVFAETMTRTFTDTLDSNGVAWPADSYIDWSFSVGESMLSVLNKMEESTVDVWVNPETYEINMLPQRGVDRTQFVFTGATATQTPVQFKLGKHLRAASSKSQSKIKNNLLLKTTEGFIEVEDVASKNKYGRIESTLDTGVSSTLAVDVAEAIFAQRAQEEEGASYDLLTLEYVPFVDFNIGDLVLAPNDKGESVPRRVMSISVEEKDGGRPLYTIEFDVIFRSNNDRVNKVLENMGGGGVGGTSPNTGGSTPGVGGPIIFPPTTPDPSTNPQIPKAPTDLVVTSEGDWSPNGVTPIAIATLDWAAVTQDISDNPMTPTYYEVRGQLWEAYIDENDDPQIREVAGPVDFGRVTESQTSLQPFNPGSIWSFKVRAGDDGAWSEYSPVVFAEMATPDTPMPAPTDPAVSSHRGTMTIEWDGTMGDFAPPPQFRYVYAEVSPESTGPWRRVGSVLFRSGGSITVPQFTVGTALWVHLIAVDGVGIESAPSNPIQHTIIGITGPDILANSVDANVIIAGSIKTNHLAPEVGNELVLDGNVTIIATGQRIDGVASDLDATSDNLAEMQTYYDFGPQGAVISSPGSVFATAVRNDRIEMLENGNVISYWNSGQMYVNQLIGQRVTLGRHQIEQFDANGTVVRAL